MAGLVVNHGRTKEPQKTYRRGNGWQSSYLADAKDRRPPKQGCGCRRPINDGEGDCLKCGHVLAEAA